MDRSSNVGRRRGDGRTAGPIDVPARAPFRLFRGLDDICPLDRLDADLIRGDQMGARRYQMRVSCTAATRPIRTQRTPHGAGGLAMAIPRAPFRASRRATFAPDERRSTRKRSRRLHGAACPWFSYGAIKHSHATRPRGAIGPTGGRPDRRDGRGARLIAVVIAPLPVTELTR